MLRQKPQPFLNYQMRGSNVDIIIIKECEREAEKWKKIEGEMQKKLGKKEEKKIDSVDDFWRSKEAIGENEDGEQIFNIVEFSNPINTQEGKKKKYATERIE